MNVGVDEGPRFPWKGLLTRPRETLAIILDEDPTRHVLALMFGVPLVLAFVATVRASAMGLAVTIPLAISLGGAVAIALGLFAVTLRWLGRMLGGSGDLARVTSVVAWALVPTLLLAPFLLSRDRDVLRGAWTCGALVHLAFTVTGLSNAHSISLPRSTLVVALAFGLVGGLVWTVQHGGSRTLSIAGVTVILVVGILAPAALVIACWRGWRMAG